MGPGFDRNNPHVKRACGAHSRAFLYPYKLNNSGVVARLSRVYIQDSTTIVLPPDLADVWRGCGDRTPHGNAVCRLTLTCVWAVWRDSTAARTRYRL